MADSMRVQLEGMEELNAALRELEASTEPKVVKQALRASARPIITDARRRVRSRRVAKALKTIGVQETGVGEVTAAVGLPSKSDGFMGLWIERGTGPRMQRNGRRTGSMPADPFLRPSLDATKDQVIATFGEEMWKRIAKYGGP